MLGNLNTPANSNPSCCGVSSATLTANSVLTVTAVPASGAASLGATQLTDAFALGFKIAQEEHPDLFSTDPVINSTKLIRLEAFALPNGIATMQVQLLTQVCMAPIMCQIGCRPWGLLTAGCSRGACACVPCSYV